MVHEFFIVSNLFLVNMGKSKFQSKVEQKIQTSGTKKKSRHVYYDEKIAQKGPRMSKNVFVLLIGIIIIGVGTGSYFLLMGNENRDVNGGNTTTTTPEGGLQEGDLFKFHYKLWNASVEDPEGFIDTSAAPDQDSTTSVP